MPPTETVQSVREQKVNSTGGNFKIGGYSNATKSGSWEKSMGFLFSLVCSLVVVIQRLDNQLKINMSNYAAVGNGNWRWNMGWETELKRVETACKDGPNLSLSLRCFS